MDWFSIFLEVLTLGGLSILHIAFVARISGKEWKIWHMAGYFLMLCLCQKMLVMLKVPDSHFYCCRDAGFVYRKQGCAGK